MRSLKIFSMMLLAGAWLSLASGVGAEEKTWIGAEGLWSDGESWSPASEPTTVDDVMIPSNPALVSQSATFQAKSLTLGGAGQAALITEQFISGTFAPASSSAVAALNRRDGRWLLRGSSGKVVLKGSYKDSEQSLAEQPSLVVWVK